MFLATNTLSHLSNVAALAPGINTPTVTSNGVCSGPIWFPSNIKRIVPAWYPWRGETRVQIGTH